MDPFTVRITPSGNETNRFIVGGRRHAVLTWSIESSKTEGVSARLSQRGGVDPYHHRRETRMIGGYRRWPNVGHQLPMIVAYIRTGLPRRDIQLADIWCRPAHGPKLVGVIGAGRCCAARFRNRADCCRSLRRSNSAILTAAAAQLI